MKLHSKISPSILRKLGFVILLTTFVIPKYLLYAQGDYGGLANFTTYTTEQGLPLSSIASSFRDRFGNLWFGTYGGGVSRYDGKSFTTFGIINGLPSNVVLSIYEDSKGNMWFGTNRKGICKYDGRTFTTYFEVPGLLDNTILSIAEDKVGNMWFGTYGGGVSCFDGKKFKAYTVKDGLADNNVRAILQDKDGFMWFGTILNGISRFDGKKFKNFNKSNGLSGDTVFTIIQDKLGKLWFGTLGGGISVYDGKEFKYFTNSNGLASNRIWCSYIDQSGELWFGTQGGGISRYDGKSFTSFSSLQGLPNDYIYTITSDKGGHIWMGTYGAGITRYDGRAFTSYSSRQGLRADIIYSILEDSKGNIWLGTYNNGISMFKSKNLLSGSPLFTKYFSMENGLKDNSIKSIYEDSKGNIWFGTIGGGVSKYNPATTGGKFITYTTKNGLTDNRVNTILEDRKGYYWFGTAGGGISRFDGKEFKNFTIGEGLAHNIVLCSLLDKKGNIWFGTSGGVSKYDGQKFTNFTTKNGLSQNIIYSIFEDNDGNIWLGSDGTGIMKYDGKSFSYYTTEDGLSDNTVGQILQDKKGRIFIGTNWGISVLTGWKGDKPIFEIYSKRTGFPIKDVNAGQRGMYLDSQGIIWIATGADNTALIRFDYEKIKRDKTPPIVTIQGVKLKDEVISWYSLKNNTDYDSTTIRQQETIVFGKKLDSNEIDEMREHYTNIKFNSIAPIYPVPIDLMIPYDHNQITIEYAAIEVTRPKLVKYKYYLEGYDKQWSPWTDNTSAVFGNMSEGKYTFYLKAKSPEGIWSETISYSFTVMPPWYRSFWAYMGYFILFVLMLYLVVYINSFRLKRKNIELGRMVDERTRDIQAQAQELKEVNASKDKFFRIIAHDLRSPLSGFLKLTDLMANQSNNISVSEYADISNSLNKSADNLYKLMNNLLEWATIQQSGIKINKESLNLNELINQNIATITDRLTQKKVSILNSVNPNLEIFADEKMINTVFRNLLSNAVKFTKQGDKISIDAEDNENEIHIIVSDTGIGISEGELIKLFKIDEKVSRKGTDNEPSTGLGLVLCKEFIDIHGGNIWAESEEYNWSKFHITIPKA